MKKILIFITAIFLSIGVFGQDLNYVNLRMMKAVVNSKADTSLSNLSSVAINSNLLPNAAGTIDLGSATLPFDDLHLDTASQINFHNGDITATHSDGTLTFAGGNIVLPSTTSIGDVYATEISYVNGVTSAIQTQLNNKADTAGAIEIGDVAILLGDTLYSQNPAYYTQRQVDSIVASIPSWDSTYIYERHDSLLTAFNEFKTAVTTFIPPYFGSAEVGDSAARLLIVKMSENMVTDSIPDDETFMFTEGANEIDVTSASISNDTLFLVLATTPQKDSTLLIDYTKPTPTATNHTIEDSDLNETKTWANKVVTNHGLYGPTLSGAEIGTFNDSIIAVKFSRYLDQDSVPPVSAFSVKENGVTFGVYEAGAITIDEDSLFIPLDSAVFGGTSVTLSYARDWPYLQDSAGYYTSNFTNTVVTNNSVSYPTFLRDDGHTVGWFMASDSIVETANAVRRWGDYSSADHDLLQASASNMPTFVDAGGDADDYIIFDGTDDYMKTSAFTWNQPYHIYIVASLVEWTNSDAIFDGNADTGGLFYNHATDPLVSFNAGTQMDDVSLTEGTFYIMRVSNVSNSGTIILNQGTPEVGPAGTNNMGGFTLARWGSTENYYGNIKVKEIILRNQTDSAGDVKLIYNYLAGRYGFALIP